MSPMPTSAWESLSPSNSVSMRMPDSFLPLILTSLGHLTAGFELGEAGGGVVDGEGGGHVHVGELGGPRSEQDGEVEVQARAGIPRRG